METKHTPGPWRLSKEYVFGPDKSVVATVFRELPAEEANAKLIAAAPDQHEAHSINLGDLEMLAKAIEAGDPKAELTMRVSDLVIRTRAAIAKAIS